MREKDRKRAACFLAVAGCLLSGCGYGQSAGQRGQGQNTQPQIGQEQVVRNQTGQEQNDYAVSDAFLTVYDDGAGKDGKTSDVETRSAVQGHGTIRMEGCGESDVYDVVVRIIWRGYGASETDEAAASDMEIEVTMPRR